MFKRALIVAAVTGNAAFAQTQTMPDPSELSKCPPIGQTAKGERIYSMDCAAINTVASKDYKPEMPPTNMKETVIPKPGGVQNPETTPTKGEPK